MDDLDPDEVDSLEDLAECLRQVHLRADKPAYRELEKRTIRASELLPGTGTPLKRVRLGRTTLSDVLLARKFPGKAFMLTFVDSCGIDLENDRRWEQAWDRLARRYLRDGALADADQLQQQLAAALADADQLQQQLAAALAAKAEADQERQRAENTARQVREQMRSEIKRIQAKLERATAEAAQAHQAARAASSSGPSKGQLLMETPWAWAKYAVKEPEAPYATPLVCNLAAEHGIDLAQLTGTGVGGRIRKQDVLRAVDALPERQPPLVGRPADEIPVCMPKIGEAEPAPDRKVARWLKREGDRVEQDEPLFEFYTDTMTFEIPSPASGILSDIFVAEDETAAAGSKLAIIKTPRADQPPSSPAARSASAAPSSPAARSASAM